MEFGLDGLTMEKTVDELLIKGWKDWAVTWMKTTNPQDGGDPSYNNILIMGDKNTTLNDTDYP